MTVPKFEYVPIEGLETDAISIREGDYDGLDFHYGTVRFNEREDGQMEMKFNYNILKKPDGFEDDDKFHQFAGDLLVHILEEELPSLTQESAYEDIGDPPQMIEDNIERLKTEQVKARTNDANSGTDDSSTSDSQ